MRIQSLEISNYRALRDTGIDFGPATVLIGENNCGKSAFLRALDIFFSGGPRVKAKDFSDDNFQSPINITVSFSELTPHERKEFSSNLLDGNLVVTRRLTSAGGKDHGQYFVSARVNPDFTECRNTEGKTDKRTVYKQLQKNYDLPDVSNADQIDALLEDWEAKPENKGALKIERVGAFKGWKNVAVGKLKEKTEFIFIKAMEDAEQIDGDKNSPVRALVNTIARQTIENTEKYKQFIQSANREMADLTDPKNVPLLGEISGELTAILGRYYRDSGIKTTWEPITQIQPAFPTAAIEVTNNEFTSAIDGVGHGLQRAIVLTVLQYMAERKAAGKSGAGEKFAEAESDIIIAIEEPESFQHPTKQRLFANVLRGLTVGFNETTGIRIQTISVTHSPLMVSLSDCDNIRMVQRIKIEGKPNVAVSEISLDDCARRTAEISGRRPEQAWTGSQFAAKLHTFGPELAEGFFAKCVILVEGVGDMAIMSAAYRLLGRDPHAEGIVIAEVTGKNNLDRPIVIFDELDIPCYWIFDNDQKKAAEKQNVKTNRILQRLGGIDHTQCTDWPNGVNARFAAWAGKVEDYVQGKAPDKFEEVKSRISAEYHIDAENCLKFPASASAVLKAMADAGISFPEIVAIIGKVDELIGG